MPTVAERLCSHVRSSSNWHKLNSSLNWHVLSSRLTQAHVYAELAAEELRQFDIVHMSQYHMARLSHHLVHNVQVDVSEEEDQFQAVTTACLTVLILAVETRLDTALQQMTRVPWATLETVSFSLSLLTLSWWLSDGGGRSCSHAEASVPTWLDLQLIKCQPRLASATFWDESASMHDK